MDGLAQYLIHRKVGFLLQQPVALGVAAVDMKTQQPSVFSFTLMPTTAMNAGRAPLHMEAANG